MVDGPEQPCCQCCHIAHGSTNHDCQVAISNSCRVCQRIFIHLPLKITGPGAWYYTQCMTLLSYASAEAYRRAVELNPRDYRAWYGLGQTYELLRMPFYALYYFRRATQLRPHDARMWCAMGQCYENDQLQSVDKDKMEVAGIRCYRRAVQNGDREGIALHKLVSLEPVIDQKRKAKRTVKGQD